MASPLHVFRKYQYLFLVAFGIMLMFAFVIAPPLSNYLQSRAGAAAGANPVVLEWKRGAVHEAEISGMRTQHLLTVRFLQSLVQRAEVEESVPVERKGQQIQLIKGRSYPLVGRATAADGKMIYQILVQGEVVEVPESSMRPVVPKVPLIPEATSEKDLIQKMLLAEKADEMGVVITEAAILDYFDNLCDATPSQRPNYSQLLLDATNGRLSERQLMAQMTVELLAQRAQMMSQSGLFAVPPDELFVCFNKLNRRVVAEFLPIEVASFISKVREPSEQEVQALYDEGKERFPLPTSPLPGFKRRKEIAFGYFKGVFDDFLNKEMEKIQPTITDQQIEEYYEKNKDTEFKIPELPAAEDEADTAKPADEGATESGRSTPDKPAGESGAVNKPAPLEPGKAPDSQAASPTAPATTPPGSTSAKPATGAKDKPPSGPSTPQSDAAAKKVNATKRPAAKSSPEPPPAETAKPEKADPKEGKKDVPSGQKSGFLPGPSQALEAPAPWQFVGYRADDSATGDQKQAGGSAQSGTDSGKSETGKGPAKPDESPAKKDGADSAPASKSSPAGDKKVTEPSKAAPSANSPSAATPPSKPADATTTTPQAGTGVTKPDQADKGDMSKPTAHDGAAAADAEQPPKKEVKYKPLDDAQRKKIRETLARRQARPVAQEKLDGAIEAVRAKVDQYAHHLIRADVLDDVQPPEPLDFEALASEHGLAYEKTPLLNALDVSQIQIREEAEQDPSYYDFARATETVFDQRAGMMRRTIVEVGFGDDVELFTPRRLVDGLVSQGSFAIPPEVVYLYWRIEQEPESVPPLNKIRDEVVTAWKLRQAVPLAKAEAEKLVQQAKSQPGKSLAEVFANEAKRVIRSQEFSWMTRGAAPAASGGTPTLSPVNGTVDGQNVSIAGAGDDFMRALFALSVNDVGITVDEPRTLVYVTRVAEESPPEDQRRTLFYAAGFSQDLASLVQMEQGSILRSWYDDLEKEFDVTWKREPIRDWNRR